jgi:cation-transporting P-type ATPase E
VPGFVSRVLRFAGPAGLIVAAATFSAYALAQARGLPLTEQRTAATLVTLILSLCVLALLAMPLTWRRIALLVAALAGFALLFPAPAVRTFYELELPHGALTSTLLIAALGAAALTSFWVLSRRQRRGTAETDRE